MTPAFKEWAIIVESLGRGMQCLVLRKGGIHEGKAGFRPEHNRFWLLPTGFHQHADKVKPEIAALDIEFSADPISFRYMAECVDTFKLTDIEQVRALAPFHYWKETVIEERFQFGKWQGLYGVFLKIYQVDAPASLPNAPEYAGCKSWVNVPLHWPEKTAMKAVLPQADLEQQLKAMRTVLC